MREGHIMGLVPFLLASMVLLIRQEAVGALKILKLSVPPYLRRGESARLECSYDLETDNLRTVTWYKDTVHIFTYLQGKKQVHSIDGVKIDAHNSNSKILFLQKVSLNSTGYYTCEVGNDKSPFMFVKSEAYMEVIEPPQSDPKITGEEKIYATGDILALNCTSDFSYPAAQLQWFINDVLIDPDSEVLYVASHGLHRTRSSLRLELNPLHLAAGRIEVKCTSTVRTSAQVAKAYINVRSTKIYVQGQASLSTPSASLLLVVLLIWLQQKK